MHSARAVEEHAQVGRDGGMSSQQVLEDGGAAATGVRTLRDLGELERIAEQDDVASRGTHGERIGQRDLPGLVYDERIDQAGPVELVMREEPRRTGEQVDARSLGDQLVELGLARDRSLRVLAFGVACARLLETSEAEPFVARGSSDLVQ